MKEIEKEYGYNLFEQVSYFYDKDYVNSFIYNRYKDKIMYSNNGNEHIINNLFLNEISILKVKNSNIKIDTNYDKCTFLKDLRYFNGILFVCNFKEQEYFFIKNVRKVPNIMSTKRQKIKDNMDEKMEKTKLNQMDIF